MKIDLLYDAFMAPLENFAGLSVCRGRLLPRAGGAVLEAGFRIDHICDQSKGVFVGGVTPL